MAQTVKSPLVAQTVKNVVSAMRETWVWFLGWEDPLEKEIATHTPVFLPGEPPWTEDPGRIPSMGSQRVRHDGAIKHRTMVQYFGYLIWRANSLEKTLMLERLRTWGEGDDRGWDGWMASSTQWIWDWVDSGSWWWAGRPGVLQFMGLQRVGHDWATELNWTDSNQDCVVLVEGHVDQ